MPTTLEQIQYGFDRDSRRTWQKRPLSTTQDEAYQYDALSQVSAAARGGLNSNTTAISGTPTLAESWAYDPTGNWRSYHTAANGEATLEQHRVHDRGNRLTQIEDNPHNQVLDRAGRVRQTAPDASGDWNGKLEMTWDAWSRITQVKNNGSVAGEYTYDGLFRRATREVDSETLHSYYNDQWRPVEERKDSETTTSMSYLWGARHRDDLVRRDRAVGGTTLNETRYILMDYFNPAAITDEEGTVTERYAFSAFGVRTILNPDYMVRSSSECAMEFSFQGQFLDLESGLMNYGYRYYSPHLGRWVRKDPIAERGGVNIYGMCGDDPVNLIDKDGRATTLPLPLEQESPSTQNDAPIKIEMEAGSVEVSNEKDCCECKFKAIISFWSYGDGRAYQPTLRYEKEVTKGDCSAQIGAAKPIGGGTGFRFGNSTNPFEGRWWYAGDPPSGYGDEHNFDGPVDNIQVHARELVWCRGPKDSGDGEMTIDYDWP